MMEFAGVKLLLVLLFFGGLLYLARWAAKKMDEYFDDE